jgi:hypothetical protein
MESIGVSWMLLVPLGAGVFIALDLVRRTIVSSLIALKSGRHEPAARRLYV